MSTPSAADLQRDAAAQPELTERAAARALVSYVDLVNAGLRGEGVAELADATDPQCSCYALVELIEEGTDAGGEFVDAEFTASDVTVRSTDGATAVVRAHVDVSAYQVKSPDGLILDSTPADSYVADYTLRTDGEQATVVAVEPVRPAA
ncbi:MAG TPA: hypothetical protein VFJ14_00715 [Nocardioidaceae bacterium]|nr:hypothetical protein [Nocardioidaceae bacterium]